MATYRTMSVPKVEIEMKDYKKNYLTRFPFFFLSDRLLFLCDNKQNFIERRKKKTRQQQIKQKDRAKKSKRNRKYNKEKVDTITPHTK